jgi:putative ABC transport system ATP-binding protein
MQSDGFAVVLEDVKKDYYVKGRAAPVQALRGTTAEIEKGTMVAIRGESGSGKTTLLQIIGALDIPTSGKVLVNGKDLSKMSEAELTEHRARTIGFVFQAFNLIPNLTAIENVMLPMEALDVPKEERESRAYGLLKTVGMEGRVDYRPMKLSGGEQQRVSIARALANDPAIILADEPTGNLDSKTGREIISLMNKLRKDKNRTVILVTHSVAAANVCYYTYVIKDGVMVSRSNLVEEKKKRRWRDRLKSDLSFSDEILDKLSDAGYDNLDKLTNIEEDELYEIINDDELAERVLEKMRSLMTSSDKL